MKLATDGYSRNCLLIGNYAVKFPSVRNGLRAFLMGWLGNIAERDRWKYESHPRLSPVLMSFLGGFFNIHPRYYEILERELTRDELANLPICNPDPKRSNYAMLDGVIIVLDYGHSDAWIKQ